MADPRKSLKELAEEFYMWLGHCISSWALVEGELFQICRDAIGCREDQAAIIYVRTPTIASRLKLTDELLQNVLPSREDNHGKQHPDAIAWASVRTKCDELIPTRNRLAHQPVTAPNAYLHYFFGGRPDSKPEHNAWIQSHVGGAERLRGNRKGIKPLKLKDLEHHLSQTKLLTEQMKEFREKRLQKLLAKREQPQSPQNQG